ncbi:hypothetical protein [Hyphomicrobium sp.]|uniref:hypothetical protein n=1 Tax=Hyphomicrobium sp. TaxID=82 RepID=UPI003F6E8231
MPDIVKIMGTVEIDKEMAARMTAAFAVVGSVLKCRVRTLRRRGKIFLLGGA